MHTRVSEYDVIWDSPSGDATGSMPLGNGDVALNAWLETSGDLLLLIAKSDAWDEHSIPLKLGRVRIKCSPSVFTTDSPIKWSLHLKTAEIEIASPIATLKIWVDANRNVIHVEAIAPQPIEMSATLEMWRTEPRQIKTQTSDMYKNLAGKNADPQPTMIQPDTVLEDSNGRIVWCHHNAAMSPDPFEVNMKLQGLGGFISQMQHPLRDRTFGAILSGDGFSSSGALSLKSTAAKTQHHLSIVCHSQYPSTIEQWKASIEQLARQIQSVSIDQARREHDAWWEQFWNRSWIYVTSDVSPQEHKATHRLTQAYILMRFMSACAGRGPSPIKHNGSLFSVGKPDDPDYRRWGGPGYWFMNQRLVHWPMLAAGDFDLIKVWLQMYRDALPLQMHRTQKYFKHGGAHYPETITFWGAEVSSHYGWQPFEERTSPEAETPYLKYYWTGAVELVLIMCEFVSYTGDSAFAKSNLLPVAYAVLEFFDAHYPRDEHGKIQFAPAQSLETWHWAINPLPEIAGLSYVISKLLQLPEEWIEEAQRIRWIKMRSELPAIPLGENDGKRVILPAEKFDIKKNSENPELYAVFPYRIFGVGKPDLQLARDTFDVRLNKSHDCWSQDEIHMALLGLAEEARGYLLQRSSEASHSDSRFPAFWNQFHDWIPDIDHGGVLSLALQLMLLQVDEEQTLMLPAWPKEWTADFKLHTPGQQVVQASVRDGEIKDLVITAAASS